MNKEFKTLAAWSIFILQKAEKGNNETRLFVVIGLHKVGFASEQDSTMGRQPLDRAIVNQQPPAHHPRDACYYSVEVHPQLS
jgi:hypothetical protein